MAILEGGHIVPPPHSSYIQKPRAIRVNEIKPCMIYIFEPLRTCKMYLSTHHGHLLTLVASNGLHFQKKLIFSCIKCIFLNFYFIMALYMP